MNFIVICKNPSRGSSCTELLSQRQPVPSSFLKGLFPKHQPGVVSASNTEHVPRETLAWSCAGALRGTSLAGTLRGNVTGSAEAAGDHEDPEAGRGDFGSSDEEMPGDGQGCSDARVFS